MVFVPTAHTPRGVTMTSSSWSPVGTGTFFHVEPSKCHACWPSASPTAQTSERLAAATASSGAVPTLVAVHDDPSQTSTSPAVAGDCSPPTAYASCVRGTFVTSLRESAEPSPLKLDRVHVAADAWVAMTPMTTNASMSATDLLTFASLGRLPVGKELVHALGMGYPNRARSVRVRRPQ